MAEKIQEAVSQLSVRAPVPSRGQIWKPASEEDCWQTKTKTAQPFSLRYRCSWVVEWLLGLTRMEMMPLAEQDKRFVRSQTDF